jgi:hypothetical protein
MDSLYNNFNTAIPFLISIIALVQSFKCFLFRAIMYKPISVCYPSDDNRLILQHCNCSCTSLLDSRIPFLEYDLFGWTIDESLHISFFFGHKFYLDLWALIVFLLTHTFVLKFAMYIFITYHKQETIKFIFRFSIRFRSPNIFFLTRLYILDATSLVTTPIMLLF